MARSVVRDPSTALGMTENTLCILRAFAVQLYFSRARMRLVIYASEMLEIQMRVNLRGAQIGVTQQLLHGAQVAGRFENMRGE